MFKKTCCNCDKEFTSPRREAQFCETKCRKEWHNRAATIGREMYHVVMNIRYNRKEGEKEMALLWKLAEEAHNITNGGKRRFDDISEVKARNPQLNAVTLSKNIAGKSKYAA